MNESLVKVLTDHLAKLVKKHGTYHPYTVGFSEAVDIVKKYDKEAGAKHSNPAGIFKEVKNNDR